MIKIFVNISLNGSEDVDILKTELEKIFIQYETDKYGLTILLDEDELLSVFELFIGRPIVFSII